MSRDKKYRQESRSRRSIGDMTNRSKSYRDIGIRMPPVNISALLRDCGSYCTWSVVEKVNRYCFKAFNFHVNKNDRRQIFSTMPRAYINDVRIRQVYTYMYLIRCEYCANISSLARCLIFALRANVFSINILPRHGCMVKLNSSFTSDE